MKKWIIIGVAVLFSYGCTEKCKPSFVNLSPSDTHLTIDKGETLSFSGEVTTCAPSERFQLKWYLNGEEVSYGNSFEGIACDSWLNSSPLTLELRAEEVNGERTLSHTWTIKVNDVPLPPKPQEVTDAINLIKGINVEEPNFFGFDGTFNPDTKTVEYPDNSTTPRKIAEFENAISTIENYLTENPCDIIAHYAAGLGRAVLLIANAEPRYYQRENMTPVNLITMVTEEVLPIYEHFRFVKQEGDEGFIFVVKNLQIIAVHDNPSTPNNEVIKISLSGEHDWTDVHFFLAGIEAGLGWFNVGNAFEGLFDFGLQIPDEFEIFKTFASPDSPFIVEEELIKRLKSDPNFLTLKGPGGEEGKNLLQTARNYFINAIDDMLKALELLQNETDDQSSDLIRYWDCGPDGVCPGDVDERVDPTKSCDETDYVDYNLNGKCNRAHCDTPGANPNDCESPDPGEGNGVFDYGEPAGTEMVSIHTYETQRISIPVSDTVERGLMELKRNIIGPEPFDFDSVLGVGKGFTKNVLRVAGIPYPEIRLSEFFDTPSSLRSLFPLYDKTRNAVIIDRETEPFQDVGIDGLPTSQESAGTVWGSPAAVCDEKGPDRCHDNLDLDCDPTCNSNDGYDNDGDGACAPDDCKVEGSPCQIASANGEVTCDDVSSLSTNADIGVEGNFSFDFIDLNGNGTHDPGEPSEPFDDIGIGNSGEGKGNNKFDMKDMAHIWPSGENVGGNHPGVERDPRDGTSADKNGELIDLYYLFFPDPTFSGVITFPDPVLNSDGETLNKNAVFHRFIYKSLEMLTVVAPQFSSALQ